MASHITLPSSVLSELNGAVAVKYMNFVCYSLFAYDFLLTVPEEVRLIWPWEWRIGKVLYLLTRYPVFFEAAVYSMVWFDRSLSATDCKRLFDAGSWLGTAGIMIAQWIICIRTTALWERKPVVVAFLVFMCLSTEIPAIIFMYDFLDNLKWSLSPFPTISRCNVSLSSSKLFVDYALIMSVEISVITLTVWKGVSHWKMRGSRLLTVLYRDGIVFFVGLFLMSCANAAMYNSSEKTISGVVLSELQRVLHAILSSRIILHLRAANAEPETVHDVDASGPHSPHSPLAEDLAHLHGNVSGIQFVGNSQYSSKWDAESGGFTITVS